MKNRRFYKIGLLICFIVMVGSLFMPESMGDNRYAIFGLGFVCFPVFLIALIVSSIRAKIKAKKAAKTFATPFVPIETAQISTPAPTTAPVSTEKNKALNLERVHVRGLNYHTDNIVAVAMENEDYNMSEQEFIENHEDDRVYQYDFFVKGALVPEPDNKYDPNAIMVQADGLCIGYVPAGSTSHIRKLMESGRIDHMELKIGGGMYKEVVEDDDGDYQIEIGTKNYSAILEIYMTED